MSLVVLWCEWRGRSASQVDTAMIDLVVNGACYAGHASLLYLSCLWQQLDKMTRGGSMLLCRPSAGEAVSRKDVVQHDSLMKVGSSAATVVTKGVVYLQLACW
jgi:hypothetical protein